jgi:hypothetical protein
MKLRTWLGYDLTFGSCNNTVRLAAMATVPELTCVVVVVMWGSQVLVQQVQKWRHPGPFP